MLRDEGRHAEARAALAPFLDWAREYPGARDWGGLAHFVTAQTHEAEGALDAALAHYDAIAEDSPERIKGLVNGARVLLLLRQPERAVQRLQRTVELGLAGSREHHNLGVALSWLGRHTEATRHFAWAHELEPDDPQLLQALAISLATQGGLREAADVLEEVLRRWPGRADARGKLGEILARLEPRER